MHEKTWENEDEHERENKEFAGAQGLRREGEGLRKTCATRGEKWGETGPKMAWHASCVGSTLKHAVSLSAALYFDKNGSRRRRI